MYFWKYILAKKAGLSQKKCNMALYGLPVLPIAEAFEKTLTGNPITITDALAQDALSLQVAFEPTQDGTPSIDSKPTTEPYLSKVIPRGNKEYYSLVGATVAWNQLLNGSGVSTTTKYGVTITRQGNSHFIVSGTSNYESGDTNFYNLINPVKAVVNHKYLFSSTSSIFYLNGYDTFITPRKRSEEIVNATSTGRGGFSLRTLTDSQLASGTVFNEEFDCIICDLTLMFGSTIADYAYSLEQATAGAGIAWLKSYGFFTEDYYAYNPGELISVNTSGHKTVGFNQWDERWEQGSISDVTGEPVIQSGSIRSKNFIPCTPNTTYYAKSGSNIILVIDWYDKNKSFINAIAATNTTRVSPTNAYYFKIRTVSTYGETYHHDICINISDPQKNGTYKPYVSNTYPIDPTDLRGLFKLDVNNKLTCKGDIYPPSGNVSRKYGIVDLGTLNYGRSQTGVTDQYRFNTNGIAGAVKIVASNKLANIITAKYVTVKGDTEWATEIDKVVWIDHIGAINIIDKSYTDAATFKTAMNGVYLVYELATPTTESATPYTSPIDVEAGGTEEFVDSRTVPIPVGNETYYASEFAVNGKTSVAVSHSATEGDTPTEYEVEFTQQSTVYGGTVDIVSGVLSVTWAILNNPQNLNWISNSSAGMKNFQTDRGTVSKKSGSNNWKCSRYSNGFIGTDKSEGIFIFDSGEVCIRDYRYWEHGGTSAEEAAFKASLADVTIAYELATPQTYNLTSEQVTMLLGNNYLETEDGTITITYMAGK